MRLGTVLLNLLFPEKCAFCRSVIKPGQIVMCKGCVGSLPFTNTGCKKKGDFFTLCVSPLYYEGMVRQSLLRYKFRQCTSYAKAYAPMVFECIEKQYKGEFDILSWVPVSGKRLRKRGYDQARLLAEEVGKLCGLSPIPVLKKHRHVPAQSGMGTAEKRKANISGAYSVIAPVQIYEKRILLIDDIITTGSTLAECAKILMREGAGKVMCAAVARDRD